MRQVAEHSKNICQRADAAASPAHEHNYLAPKRGLTSANELGCSLTATRTAYGGTYVYGNDDSEGQTRLGTLRDGFRT